MTSNSKFMPDRKHIKHRKTRNSFLKIIGMEKADQDKPVLKK